MAITNDYEDIVLVISEFIIQCQLIKIIHKLSLIYICEELFNVYNPEQKKHVPWDCALTPDHLGLQISISSMLDFTQELKQGASILFSFSLPY